MEKEEVLGFIKKLYVNEMLENSTPEEIEQYARNFTDIVMSDDVALSMVRNEIDKENPEITISDLQYAINVE